MPAHNCTAIIRLPFGVIGIHEENNVLTGIDFLPDITTEKEPETELAARVAAQLQDYASNPLAFNFDLPVKIQGTAFQQKVWRALKKIPAGEVISYGELARKLNTGARAVGNACRRNPVPLVVPCHRVVSSNGIGGFAGDRHAGWTRIKRWLLKHEGYSI